jgi:hypothetical protein
MPTELASASADFKLNLLCLAAAPPCRSVREYESRVAAGDWAVASFAPRSPEALLARESS